MDVVAESHFSWCSPVRAGSLHPESRRVPVTVLRPVGSTGLHTGHKIKCCQCCDKVPLAKLVLTASDVLTDVTSERLTAASESAVLS